MNLLVTLILLFFFPAKSHAQETRLIVEIKVIGLERTREEIVRNELLLKEGDLYDKRLLEESLIKLRNMFLFRYVLAELHDESENKVRIDLVLDEKWTLIPVMRGGGGGGTQFFIVGVYDINVAGRYFELGTQYEEYSGAPGLVAWYKNRRFLGRNMFARAEGGQRSRSRSLFNGEGELTGAFGAQKRFANAFLLKELHPYLSVGLGGELTSETFPTRILNYQQSEANLKNNFTSPTAQTLKILNFELDLGRLASDELVIEGLLSEINLDRSVSLSGPEPNFYKLRVKNSAFLELPHKAVIGVRYQLGTTNAELPNGFFLGGLEHARGFLEDEFYGQSYSLFNFEARIPSFYERWFALHHIAFSDFVRVRENQTNGLKFWDGMQKSVGTGVRLVVPKIHRMVVRLDYAWVLGSSSKGLTFGMQQFF